MKREIATILIVAGASSALVAGTDYLGGKAVLEQLSNVTLGEFDADNVTFNAEPEKAVGVLDWSKFNIGAGQAMTFIGDSTTFFNLVDGTAGKSQIEGTISSGGSVWVINPSGVAFGSSAVVNVGGLFAAAAGKIDGENAAALRLGTATTPVFESMAGNVEVGAAKFDAGQVALVGKSVSIAGADMTSVGSLSVAAGEKVVVDVVGGGKVSFSVSEFTEGLDDIGVDVDGLALGDSNPESGRPGDLDIVSEGHVAIKNDVAAQGDVRLSTVAAEGASGAAVSYKKMSVASGKMLQGKSVSATAAGEVEIDGDVAATGDVVVESALGVAIKGAVSVGDESTLSVSAGTGIDISGKVKSAGGSSFSTAAGDVKLSSAESVIGGTVNASGDTVDIAAGESIDFEYGTLGAGSAGSLTVKGNGRDVALKVGVAVTGDFVVDGAGEISVEAGVSAANATFNGTKTSVAADVTAGAVKVQTADGSALADLEQTAGAIKADSVEAKGFAQTGGSVEAGLITVSGGDVTQTAGSVAADKLVLSGAGEVSLATGDEKGNAIAKVSGSATGLVLVNAADVEVEGFNTAGDATISVGAGNAVSFTGDNSAKTLEVKNGDVTQTGGTVAATDLVLTDAGAVAMDSTGGNVITTVSGSAKSVSVTSAGLEVGDLSVEETLALGADSKLSGAVGAGAIDAGGNTISVDGGNVEVSGSIAAGKLDVSSGAVSASGVAGDVDISGGALDAGTIDGALSYSGGALSVGETSGDFSMNAEGGSASFGKVNGSLDVVKGAVTGRNGSLEVAGTTTQSGGVIGSASDVVTLGGALSQTGGEIVASKLALNADSVVKGTVNAAKIESAEGKALVVDGGVVTATEIGGGSLDVVSGSVAAETVSGDVSLSGGTLETGAIGGDLLFNGTGALVAKDDALTVAGVTEQTTGTLGDGNGALSLNGGLQQTGGTVNAETLTLGEDSVVMGAVNAAKVKSAADKALVVDGAVVTATEIGCGSLDVVAGSVSATTVSGDLVQRGGATTADSVGGDVVLMNGTLETGAIGGMLLFDGTGTLVAKDDSLTVAGRTVQATGTLGDGNDALSFNGGIDQAGGAIDAETLTLGEDSVVMGAVNAAKIESAAGKTLVVDGAVVTATEIGGGSLDVVAGSVTATTVSGDLVQRGGATTADSVGGDVTLMDGTLETGAIGGDLKFDGTGTLVAKNDSLTVAGVTVQTTGTLGDGDDSLSFDGGLSQTGGTIDAGKVTLGGDSSQSEGAVVKTGDLVLDAAGKNVSLESSANEITGVSGNAGGANVATSTALSAHDLTADSAALAAQGDMSVAGVKSSGTVSLKSSEGSVQGSGSPAVEAADLVIESKGSVGSSGAAFKTDVASVSAKSADGGVYLQNDDDVSVKGVTASGDASVAASGDIAVAGAVAAGGNAKLGASGDVEFGSGSVRGQSVAVSAGGDILQMDGEVQTSGGTVASDGVRSAVVSSGYATMSAGGSIGVADPGAYSYVGVDAAEVTVNAGGDAAIAGGAGRDLSIGAGGITSGGDVAIYSTGTVVPGGPVTANGDVTVASRDYRGGGVNVGVGGTLASYNLAGGANPLIAVFNTVGGSPEPKVMNLPNRALVMLDGRVAGGDLQTINRLASVEAFPVQTPELKSEQGVFGNPTFLHDELDVANPLAVGAIDYILQEIPRQTFSSDFPAEVDQHLLANGLSPTTSYWFGQTQPAEGESDDEEEL